MTEKPSIVEWTPALEVGIAEIDADHRVLVDLLNRVIVGSERNDHADVSAILGELAAYTDYHFKREEALMEAAGYEHTARHVDEHRRLFDEVRQQIDDLNAGQWSAAAIARFMQRWLMRHIVGADRQLGIALAGSGRHSRY